MNLWIRSQDKSYLMPIEDIISEFGGSLFYKGIILGDYKTKERALEVLDEIQKLIEPNYIRTFEYKGYEEQPTTIVYEMPDERLEI